MKSLGQRLKDCKVQQILLYDQPILLKDNELYHEVVQIEQLKRLFVHDYNAAKII